MLFQYITVQIYPWQSLLTASYDFMSAKEQLEEPGISYVDTLAS